MVGEFIFGNLANLMDREKGEMVFSGNAAGEKPASVRRS